MLIEMLATFFEDPGLFISSVIGALFVVGGGTIFCSLLACLG